MSKQPKRFIITRTRLMTGRQYVSEPMTVAEAVEHFGYTLETGKSYEHESGNRKINLRPTTIRSLITNLTNASANAAANGCGDIFSVEEAV